jgi:F-box/leucine-rich repeat protein 10/11
MFIPSGWIHAVWTPEDSLVIGGNFLTRLHIGMQLQIMEIEKSCKVPLKYRYPHFQKVQWYSLLNYLEKDPTPASVVEDILAGNRFKREAPIWSEPEKFGPNAHADDEHYNHRYYAKTEVESWPELLQYIYRTVLIHMDRLDGIGQETRKAVMRSIPKHSAEPLELARRFAVWIAWKRGNEDVPEWVRHDHALPSRGDVKKTADPKTPEPRRVERRAVAAAEQRTSHRLGPKKVVCSSCREKKIACKHVLTVISGVAPPPAASVPKVPTPTAPAPPSPVGDAVVKQQAKEAGARLSVNSEAKRRWGKACGDCRRSKVSFFHLCQTNANWVQRRCIHDEMGQIDPAKQSLVSPSARKRKSSGATAAGDDDGHKRIKLEGSADEDDDMAMADEPVDEPPAADDVAASIEQDQQHGNVVEDVPVNQEEEEPSVAKTPSVKPRRRTVPAPLDTAPAGLVPEGPSDSASPARASRSAKAASSASAAAKRRSASEAGAPDAIAAIAAIAETMKTPAPAARAVAVTPGTAGSGKSGSPRSARGSAKAAVVSGEGEKLTEEEEASLKMAMELQAQEFGLRRRGAGR